MDLEGTMSVKETAAYLHISTKTVYRWVDQGKLSAQKVGLQLFINKDMVEAIASGRGVYIDNLVQRIDNLEQRLAELERNAQSLSGSPTAHPPPQTHGETVRPSEGHYKSNKSRSQKEPLPDDYIASERFAKDHGISPSTMRKAVTSGRLRAEENDWLAGKAPVRSAFNREQQAAFIMMYRMNEHFHHCENAECPCQQS